MTDILYTKCLIGGTILEPQHQRQRLINDHALGRGKEPKPILQIASDIVCGQINRGRSLTSPCRVSELEAKLSRHLITTSQTGLLSRHDEVDPITHQGMLGIVGPIDWVHSSVSPPEIEYLIWGDVPLGNFKGGESTTVYWHGGGARRPFSPLSDVVTRPFDVINRSCRVRLSATNISFYDLPSCHSEPMAENLRLAHSINALQGDLIVRIYKTTQDHQDL